MSAWYYLHNGQRLGPLELEALRQLRSNGEVGDTTLVWTQGMTTWTPYGQAPALSLAAPSLSTYLDPAITQQRQWSSAQTSLAIAPEDRGGPGRPISWYFEPFRKYAVFDGRAGRKEFWLFVLFNLMVFVVLGAVEGVWGIARTLAVVYQLAILVPSIGVGVRRMHDTGHRGWWLFVPIVSIVFVVQDSQPGENQYGPNPKPA